MVDPQFFWNERPALSLLPPAEQIDESDAPYELLLDRVVPVTSAFLGLREDVPAPFSSAAPKTTPAEGGTTSS